MLDELDCATLTLKKLLFFKDMKELGLNVEIIIKELQKKYNMSREKSIDFVYSKAVSYDKEKCNSKSLFLNYIGLWLQQEIENLIYYKLNIPRKT